MELIKWFLCLALQVIVLVTSLPSEYTQDSESYLPLDLRLSRRRKEPPQYMLDLYQEISGDASSSSLPYGATVVKALRIHEKLMRLSFSVAKIPSNEEILEAHLRFYQHKLNNNQRKLLRKQNFYKLSLYVIDGNVSTLVDYQMIVGHFGGWRHFKIAQILKNCIANSSDSEINFKLKAATVEGVGITIKKSSRFYKKPTVVLFSKPLVDNTSNSLLNGSTLESHRNRVKRSISVNNSSDQQTSSPPGGCELRPLNVDFESIGWSSWIASPTSYNASQCSGRCDFPLGQENHPTNHATVLSIMNRNSKPTDNVQVSHPCCVPISYKSLTLLYYDADNNVLLKTFDRMVATQCGCR